MQMTMTDADHLSTPVDMVELLKRLTKIMRDVETLPDVAQQRFWDDTEHHLQETPAEDIRLANVGARSVTVLYSILVSMCGPKLNEMVNGATKEYYEGLVSQMKAMASCEWDLFLDQKFDETKGTDHEGSIIASVTLRTVGAVVWGTLRRVDGDSSLLKLTTDDDREHYFLSKDILKVEITKPPAEVHDDPVARIERLPTG